MCIYIYIYIYYQRTGSGHTFVLLSSMVGAWAHLAHWAWGPAHLVPLGSGPKPIWPIGPGSRPIWAHWLLVAGCTSQGPGRVLSIFFVVCVDFGVHFSAWSRYWEPFRGPEAAQEPLRGELCGRGLVFIDFEWI